MSSLQSNIAKGAIRVSEDLVIGGYAETCLKCGSPQSSDGCTSVQCVLFRGEPALQSILRLRAQPNSNVFFQQKNQPQQQQPIKKR
jgi:hypothetical protein